MAAVENLTDNLANTSISSEQDSSTAYAEANHLNLRALVSTREAGIIIGKAGANVAAIRESTGVKSGVSKAIPGVQDRVLSVAGTSEEIAKAYTMVAQNLIDNNAASTEANIAVAPSNSAASPTTVRLLIAHGVMGSIIGKQGAKIKEIQDATHVRMVASKDLLPQSTERVVEITGSPDNIGSAIYEISECLIEEADRAVGTILFHPASVHAQQNGGMAAGAGNPGFNPSHPGGYGGLSVLQPSMASSYSTRGGSMRGGRGSGTYRAFSGGRGAGPTSPSSSPQQRRTSAAYEPTSPPQQRFAPDDPNLKTQNISFPADMIGCIIGRGGSKISEIRKQSGSRINISKDPNPETGERLFSIVGTTESNEKALFLLYSSLEREKQRRDKEEGAPAEQ